VAGNPAAHGPLDLIPREGPAGATRSPEPPVGRAPAPAAAGPAEAAPAAPDQAQFREEYGQLPLSFEANQGQADARVQFLAHGSGYSLALTAGAAVLSFRQPAAARTGAVGQTPAAAGADLSMQFLGANAAPQLVGRDELPGKVNYYIGNDPSRWHSNIATYSRVEYQNVYDGINLVYYGNQQQLEYDFVVAPGADFHAIALGFTGADHVDVDARGDLVLHGAGGDIRQHQPFLYQEVGGVRQEVAGRFVLHAQDQVGFDVVAYDRSKPLVIDPVLTYSSYLGGNGVDAGTGIAVDGAGNAYVTGYTSMPFFTEAWTERWYQPGPAGDFDAFVSQVSPNGTQLVWTTFLGGMNYDRGNGIAVGGDGNVYVTGYTESPNFPTTNGVFQPFFVGNGDGFVTKLNSFGVLLRSTFIGFGMYTAGNGIAVDRYGPCVTGYTYSGFDAQAIVARYDANLAWFNGFFPIPVAFTGGGTSMSVGNGVALDPTGNAYVTGYTDSPAFPTTTPVPFNGCSDAFVAEVDLFGNIIYSTYLGMAGCASGQGIAVDNVGNAYVTGYASGPGSFAALQQWSFGPLNNAYDVFVSEVSANGASISWTTFLGGSALDVGYGIALGPGSAGSGSVSIYVTGVTFSADFPTFNPIPQMPGFGGDADAFVFRLNATGNGLIYSTFLGGADSDAGYGIAQFTDSAGTPFARVTGVTYSLDFPTTGLAFRHAPAATSLPDAFVTKING
jgi:hypothetical protein